MTRRAIRWQLAVLLMAWRGAVYGQAPAKAIPLYPGAAPGSEKWDWSERSSTNKAGLPMVTDVVRPVLLHFPADKSKAAGTAMIVAPGGGFRVLMMSYEGVDIARRLNAMGVDAFVLKYRLVHNGPGAPPARDVIKLAADDGRQAIRSVRERAGDFGVRADRVGMIGFSAGGMVTAEALFGPAETRPDFAAIIYGVRQAKVAPSPAPPLFLAVAADDALAIGGTVEQFTAYRKTRGPAELHVFQMGAHGFVNKGGGADRFMDRLEEWLRANKLLARSMPPTNGRSAPRGDSNIGQQPLQITDIVGVTHRPFADPHVRAIALVFLATECPISNSYAPELDRLYADYRSRGVRLFLVHADSSLSLADAREHARQYQLQAPVVLDTRHIWVRKTGATVTPQAAVLSPAGEVLYLGRIDNRYVALGKRREQVTDRNLRDALDAVLAGRKVSQRRTQAVGCDIPDLPKGEKRP